MMKNTHFDVLERAKWPDLNELGRFFLAPKGLEWSYYGGNDSWGLNIQGLYGTENLPEIDRVNVHLYMTGNSTYGVYLQYSKWDGRIRKKTTYYSKGDPDRLREFVRSLHGTPLSVGLFIPFGEAWKGVKEFLETDGELPTSIEWVANSDLPASTFPDP